MKNALYFVCFTIVLFVLHQWVLLPYLNLSQAIPTVYQHLLLGGFALVIYLITRFAAEHYFYNVGFLVLGFLLLKMIFVGIFITAYSSEVAQNPILKYVFVGLYFLYLGFLLLKIIPLINIDPTKK